MGTWILGTKDGICGKCRKPTVEGDEIFIKSRGVFMCKDCGEKSEGEEPVAGEMEQSVLDDLSTLPQEAFQSSLAKSMINMARDMDNGEVGAREKPAYIKELRQNYGALKMEFPPAGEDDQTDIVRKNREKMLGGQFEED
jgi:hypothetical protein